MTIDDKTRTELEAAVFRRLVEHLRARTDVQNIDLMNLAGFCRNCLSNWMKEEADAKGVAVSKDESREAVYGMPYEDLESEASGRGHAGATGGDEEGPQRALSLRFVARMSASHPGNARARTVPDCAALASGLRIFLLWARCG